MTRLSEEGREGLVAVTELPEAVLEDFNCDLPRTPRRVPVVDDRTPPDPDPTPTVEAFISRPTNQQIAYVDRPIVVIGSAKPEEMEADYSWDFDGGQVIDNRSDREKVIRYTTPGVKTIRLTVTDGERSATDSIELRVRSSSGGGQL